MNDTTAFLSGCAIAAVATFVILDKGNNLDRVQNACLNPAGNNVPSMNQTLPPTPLPSPPPVNPQQPQADSQLQLQLTENQQLKSQLQQQGTEVQQLKSQLDKQWMETQQLLLQMQAQQGRPTTAADSSLPDSGKIVLWVLGTSVLVLGIGGSIIIIVVILAMFAQSQQRYPRTTHVVHPLNVSSAPRRVYERQPRYLSPYAKVRGTSDLDDD